MLKTIEKICEDVILYNGKSITLLIFLAALIFLWFFEKNKCVRTALIYLSIAELIIFACPIYAWIGMKIDEAIYYRVFWALPVGILVCYALVLFVSHFDTFGKKAVVAVMAVLLIGLNGRLVYTNSLHFRSSNAYHIPAQVIELADALKLDNYKPIAVLPAELLPFFRQYSADVFTPYGRNMIEPQWNFKSELYDAMEGNPQEYDAAKVAECARNENCAYVVLSSAKQIKGSMEEQNYFLLNFVQGYFIYMDCNYYEIYKERNLLDADVIERKEAVSAQPQA